jgi:hypothetical protein
LAYGEAGPGQKVKIDSWIDAGESDAEPGHPSLWDKHGNVADGTRSGTDQGESIDTEHMFADGDIFTKDLTWWSLDKANTTVVQITYNPHLCE